MTKGNIFRHRDTLAKKDRVPHHLCPEGFSEGHGILPVMGFNILNPLCAFVHADT